jgi:hypothetical protein
MFFLNLSAGEFFALLGALGGLTAALYLLDRSKRKKVVSTLRFWMPARTAEEQQSRRRMREPWSLVLQLLGLLLLLLAIAQLEWGTRLGLGRDHVLLLDVSAWSAARTGSGSGSETVLAREKEEARRFLAKLGARDRVMLVRVDSLATPVTSFTTDRGALEAAINESSSGFSALNMQQALLLAQQAKGWSNGGAGEVVYIGPKLVGDERGEVSSGVRGGVSSEAPSDVKVKLRSIVVPPERENLGIERLGVKREEDDPSSWQATVTVKNYGKEPHLARLQTRFAGKLFGPRALNLGAGEEGSAEYTFVTNTAGELISQIEGQDSLALDDRAELRLPKSGALRVAVFTRRAVLLRPLLEANHRLKVEFYDPAQYGSVIGGKTAKTDIAVLDQFSEDVKPPEATLWIDPPRVHAPMPIKTVVADAVVKNWDEKTALGAGLRAKEAHLGNATVFETFEGDTAVASVNEGAIVVARAGSSHAPNMAVIGFDPLGGDLRYQVTTPLLFANLLRWLAPDAFRVLDLSAGQVGDANVLLDASEKRERIRVREEKGFAVPFTVRGQALELFTSRPGIVHIASDDRERILSLTLPDVAEFEWKAPADVSSDGAPAAGQLPGPIDLWHWLALLGAACLLAEWLLYGRQRRFQLRKKSRGTAARGESARPAKAEELVSK